MAEPGLPELPQPLLELVLSSLSLPGLVQVALTCKARHASIGAAPPELWQRAFARHLPWLPVIEVGKDAAQDALMKHANCSNNLAAGRHCILKDWDKDLEELPFDTCLSEGGDWLAGAHGMSDLSIRPLHKGQGKRVRHSLAQEILSASWHPADEHISVLSKTREADLFACRCQFAVYNVRSGACALVYNALCMAPLQTCMPCFWSPSGMLAAVVGGFDPLQSWLYNLSLKQHSPLKCASSRPFCDRFCEWSPDSSKLAMLGDDSIIFYDANSGAELFKHPASSGHRKFWCVSHKGCCLDGNTCVTWTELPVSSDAHGSFWDHPFDLCKVDFAAVCPKLEVICSNVQEKAPELNMPYLRRPLGRLCVAVCAARQGGKVLLPLLTGGRMKRDFIVRIACSNVAPLANYHAGSFLWAERESWCPSGALFGNVTKGTT